MMDKSWMVVGLGEFLWDVYPDQRRPGGAPVNAAVHAGRLGAEAHIVSAVGMDRPGDDLRHVANAWGLGTSGLQTVEGFDTGTVGVTLDEAGIPTFDCSKDTAFDHMHWNPEAQSLASQADAVILGTLAQRHADSREFIQRFVKSADHAMVVYDANFRGWSTRIHANVQATAEAATVLKINSQELEALRQIWPDEASPEIYAMSLADRLNLVAVALTLGEEGSILTDGDTLVKEPGIKTNVVDTTGCGDAYTAILTLGLLHNWPLDAIARCANGFAAFHATMAGAVPAYSQEALVAFMNEHSIDWYF